MSHHNEIDNIYVWMTEWLGKSNFITKWVICDFIELSCVAFPWGLVILIRMNYVRRNVMWVPLGLMNLAQWCSTHRYF